MRRKIAWILMAALMLSVLSMGALAAQPSIAVSVVYETGAKPGDTITVELRGENSPGLAAVQFTLGFDKSVLSCTDCKTGQALQGMLAASNPDGKDGAVIAAASATPVDGNGVLGVYTFQVRKSGDYNFTLQNVIFAQADGKEIPFTVTGAELVEDEPAETPEAPGTTETPENPTQSTFTDCTGHWAQAYIDEAAALGLVNGVGGGRYNPDGTMTRAHFVTILWRAAGSPEPAGTTAFTDLGATDSYYYKAVLWAEENQVVNGVGNKRFNPDGGVTREQLVTILHRLSGDQPGTEQLYAAIYRDSFTDAAAVSDWAADAVWWAIYHDIWCAADSAALGTVLSPKTFANRAQIAVMMTRYLDYKGGENG